MIVHGVFSGEVVEVVVWKLMQHTVLFLLRPVFPSRFIFKM
jgi:hypothetical protein